MRGIFFDEDDARAAAPRLRADGYDAAVARERLAGEDDDDDHPWAVVTDAPEPALDLLVEAYDGWLDAEDVSGGFEARSARTSTTADPPLDLPAAPKRHHRKP